MSGTNIITRIYMIDRVSGESDDFTVKNSIPKFLPIDVDNYRMDYKILNTIKEKGKENIKFLLLRFPKIFCRVMLMYCKDWILNL